MDAACVSRPVPQMPSGWCSGQAGKKIPKRRALLCDIMQVSRSGYYSWRKRGKSSRQQERERLLPKVKTIHRQAKGTYGARRISEELIAQGELCGRTKIPL